MFLPLVDFNLPYSFPHPSVKQSPIPRRKQPHHQLSFSLFVLAEPGKPHKEGRKKKASTKQTRMRVRKTSETRKPSWIFTQLCLPQTRQVRRHVHQVPYTAARRAEHCVQDAIKQLQRRVRLDVAQRPAVVLELEPVPGQRLVDLNHDGIVDGHVDLALRHDDPVHIVLQLRGRRFEWLEAVPVLFYGTSVIRKKNVMGEVAMGELTASLRIGAADLCRAPCRCRADRQCRSPSCPRRSPGCS